jgi:WD40 repeat protein
MNPFSCVPLPAACLTVVLALLCAGCEDPHNILTDNPNDPLSPSYTPKAPTALHISAVRDVSRTISWNELSRMDVVYTVERRLGIAGNFLPVGTVAAPATSYIDTTSIRTDTTYYYRVSCQSVNGHSAASAAISYSLPFPSPAGLRMTCVSGSVILLEWLDNSTFESGFRIEESVNGGSFVSFDTAPADTVQRWVANLSSGAAYRFRVAAFTSRNVSSYSGTLAIRAVTQSFERIDSALTTSGHGLVSSVTFSPDGRTLAVGGTGSVDLFWAGTGARRGAMTHQGYFPVQDLAFAPGGSVLAAAHGAHADIWDPPSGALERTILSNGSGTIAAISFDRQGSVFVCGGDSGISVTDAHDWSLIGRFGGVGINTIARVSPDGRSVAAGSPSFPLTFYRTSDGTVTGLIPGQPTVAQAAYSPDGSVIAVSGGSDLTVRLWNAGTWTLVRTLPGQTRGGSIAFSPDGRWVVATDRFEPPPPGEQTTGEATMWNVSDGNVVTTFGGSPFTGAVAFSPYGNLVALAWMGGVDVWAVQGTWVPSR